MLNFQHSLMICEDEYLNLTSSWIIFYLRLNICLIYQKHINFQFGCYSTCFNLNVLFFY